MKIFKFGGASVKSAEAIKQVAKIIGTEQDSLVIVVSAMGKMTNKLEALCSDYFYKKNGVETHIEAIRRFHYDIIDSLFEKNAEQVKDKAFSS